MQTSRPSSLPISPTPPFRPRLSRVWGAPFVALLLFLAGWGAAQAIPAPGEEMPASSGLLLVGLSPRISPAQADALFAEQGLTCVRHWPEFGLAAARLAESVSAREREQAWNRAAAALARQPDVRYVEQDWAIEAAAQRAPNDPYFTDQWALARINAATAWEATLGDPNLVIALIDSGLDLTHEDLAGMPIWRNQVEEEGRPGEDDDGNGYVDDFAGWDWVEKDNAIEDPYGHGTHVGGILAARTDNGVGIASVGRTLTVMPLRVLDERGTGFISYLVDALAYARRKGARIVNLSLVLRIDSLAVHDSVRAFVQDGGLVVAATGNYGDRVYWPAAYTETLAVAATDSRDVRAFFSNRGLETDLAAPGAMVLSTYLNNGYFANDGTSMAVPHVSALAGLVWSLRPDWSWLQVKKHLQNTAVDVNGATLPGRDYELGYGRIDAAAAVTVAGAGISFTVDYRAGQYTRIDQEVSIPLSLTVPGNGGDVLPVVRALVHHELYKLSDLTPGNSTPPPVLSGTVSTTATGFALIEMRMPSEVGTYSLHLRIPGQERVYPLSLQDGPLLLKATPERATLHAGQEQTSILFSAGRGQGDLLDEPLLVEITTTLGSFSDGSQRRSLWMVNGLLTETLYGGQVAGIAEISMSAGGQAQRTFVTVQPGLPQRISGPGLLLARDMGEGVSLPVRLELRDRYGNPIWNSTQVNFYTLDGSFAPQSAPVTLGWAETRLSVSAYAPDRISYWALVPGSFAVFQGEVLLLRHHLWMPYAAGGAIPANE